MAIAQSFTFGPAGVYTASWDGVSTLTITLTSGGAFVASLAGQNLAQVTAAPEFQQLAAGSLAPAVPAALLLQAATPAAGFALVNGTPGIVSWTAPNDGSAHLAHVVSQQVVTSLETGGAVQLNYTSADGTARNLALYPGGGATGLSVLNAERIVAPGSTVAIVQSSALTGGAAAVWAQVWGV